MVGQKRERRNAPFEDWHSPCRPPCVSRDKTFLCSAQLHPSPVLIRAELRSASASPNKQHFTSHFLLWACQAKTINSTNCVYHCGVWTVEKRGVGGRFHSPLRGTDPSSAPGTHKHWLLFSWISILLANQGPALGPLDLVTETAAPCACVWTCVCRDVVLNCVILMSVRSNSWFDLFKGSSSKRTKQSPSAKGGSPLNRFSLGSTFVLDWQSVAALTRSRCLPCMFL